MISMTRHLILIVFPLLAACAIAVATPAQLEGSKWSFVSIDGAPPVSSKAGLDIASARIGATVGCNGLGGELRIGDGTLITGPMISTMMYCDGLMDQERAVAGLLEADPQFTLSGNKLTLTGGGHKAELKQLN